MKAWSILGTGCGIIYWSDTWYVTATGMTATGVTRDMTGVTSNLKGHHNYFPTVCGVLVLRIWSVHIHCTYTCRHVLWCCCELISFTNHKASWVVSCSEQSTGLFCVRVLMFLLQWYVTYCTVTISTRDTHITYMYLDTVKPMMHVYIHNYVHVYLTGVFIFQGGIEGEATYTVASSWLVYTKIWHTCRSPSGWNWMYTVLLPGLDIRNQCTIYM